MGDLAADSSGRAAARPAAADARGAWRARVPAAALVPLAAWLLLVNMAGKFTWGWGPLTFVVLLLACALLVVITVRAPAISARRGRAGGVPAWALAALILLEVAWTAVGARAGFTRRPDQLLDMSSNTAAACDSLARGRDPYAVRTQLGHGLAPGAHLEVVGDRVTMFGIPYRYGYPYFPMMFLSYLPAFWLVTGHAAIRLLNLLLVGANLVGVALLARRLAGAADARRALLVALVATLGVAVFPREAFAYGVVDIVISTYALYAWLAASHRRYVLAGLLLGCAQACKLLPGPLLLVPLLLSRDVAPARGRILVGYLVGSLALIAPFALWHRGAFLSATLLFYLTHLQRGDDTSLWYFLPGMLKQAFLVAGVALAAVAALVVPRRASGLAGAAAAAFVSYAALMAFSKMTHLNYLWSVYPLGCVALAVACVRMAGAPGPAAGARLAG